MKIENLMEKDTVLDDDYLIVNGTDGTKKAKKSNFLSELNSSPEVIDITPMSGSNYSEYGNCYYYKKGSRVHIHIGIQGLTGGVNTTISILPSGYRPSSIISAIGFGSSWSEKAVLLITQNGELNVQSEGSYAMIDVEYDAFS